jgi:hypothetical protein
MAVAPDETVWVWVEFYGGPDDGDMGQWIVGARGKMPAMWQLDSAGREGTYSPSGRAVEGLPVVRMTWRHGAGRRREMGPPKWWRRMMNTKEPPAG